METNTLSVRLEHVRDYEFRVRFDEGMLHLLMDEPEPLGAGQGPNATRVLSAAIGNCLSASLLFCLRKAKIEPRSLHTVVNMGLARDENERLRVGATRVEIELDLDPEDRGRAARCLDIFEDYCVVTQSVRRGIEVDVAVVDGRGQELHHSRGEAMAH